MACAVSPFLLLMSLFLLISTVSTTPPASQNLEQTLKEIKNVFEETKVYLEGNIDTITSTVGPILGLIPVCGTVINSIFNLIGLLKKNDAEALMHKFRGLISKFDQYNVEQKWDSWASGAYYKPERDIEVAWAKYTTLVYGLLLEDNCDRCDNLKKEFLDAYLQYEPAIQNLHMLLTAKGATFINPISNLLAEHVRCHENNIRQYTLLINKLIYKGTIMNQFYYKHKNTESEAKIHDGAQIAYEAASAMFRVHMHCITNSMDYVKKDVEMLIDKVVTRSELADKVRFFLDREYDRYVWMVVAFKTKKSQHKIERLNSHVLSGFTEVIKDDVSVAVARQVKGTYTKAAMVKKAIEKCFEKTVNCHEVAKQLKDCSQMVEKSKVSETYTAVHAYLRESHDSNSELDEGYEVSNAPEESNQTSYIYKGTCKNIVGGKFVVLIKSDEEIMKKDPCSTLTCMEPRGTCVKVEDTLLAVCQCNDLYYGKQCEYSLDDYKGRLRGKCSKSCLVGSCQ